jgi:hypothetical protein
MSVPTNNMFRQLPDVADIGGRGIWSWVIGTPECSGETT